MQSVNAFGNHQEVQIAAEADHFPRSTAPRIGIFYEKIGSEAGIERCTGRYFVSTAAFFLEGQVEVFGFSDDGAVDVVFGITAIDVAVPASFAQLSAAVPGVPYLRVALHLVVRLYHKSGG